MKEIRKKLRFNIDIVNHCNLNCKGCGHFSPLAKKYFLPVEEFQNDMERLSYLTNGCIERLEIMGGEPLLHPNMIDFLTISRKNFPFGEINICTNGILVTKQPAAFFEECANNNISIAITTYPINLDWNLIESKTKEYGVNLIRMGTKNQNTRIWFKNHRDLQGTQDIQSNFDCCRWGNNCIILEHGRLATCVMPFKTKFYNEFYQTETFKIEERDSISIYENDSIDNILEFLASPVSSCRFCFPNDDEQIEWGVSKKEINEWS